MQIYIFCAIFITLTLTTLSCSHRASAPEPQCETRVRALFDVGSGSTNVNVSEVEICGNTAKVKRVLDDKLDAVLGLEAGKDGHGNLTPAIQEQALNTIKELRDKAIETVRRLAPDVTSIEIGAVGTHAIRTAGNSADLIRRIHDLGFTVMPLPQQREGEMGFLGAQQLNPPVDCNGKQMVTWDLGGGSQQISQQDSTGKISVVPICFSSEAFRERLVTEIGARTESEKCSNGKKTPNPIGDKNFTRAETVARNMAKGALKKFAIDSTRQCLVGLGGAHNRSIELKITQLWPQIQNCVCEQSTCTHTPGLYTLNEVQCLAKFLSQKSDCDPEMSGPYSAVTGSNAFLILGFMKELKAPQVLVRRVNMGTQLITDTTTLPWTAIKIERKL